MQVRLIFALALHILTVAQAAQYFIAAPNVVRVDVEETVLVSVRGTGVNRIPVTLYFQLAGSNDRISEDTVFVTKDEPQLAVLTVQRDRLTTGQQFVTLVATANSDQLTFQDQRPILLSYQSGFVFIQTDKPLYTPKHEVNIRTVALNQNMEPANHDIQVDIINPDNIIVERHKGRPLGGFMTHIFFLPPSPVLGNWAVTAYYGHQFQASSTIQFEVKEYVLPKFYVEVVPRSMYIVPGTENLATRVTARYLFGEPVVGNCYVIYGVFEDDGSFTKLQSKEGRLNEEGQADQDLDLGDVELENWELSLMGKRLIIQAFVTDIASSETVNANNTMVTFNPTPFKFNWDLTQRFFKPGLSFSVKANLQYMSGLPADGVPVTASAVAARTNGPDINLQGDAGDVLRKLSGAQGEVDFRLDVPDDATQITVTLETDDPDLEGANTRDTTVIQPQSLSSEYLVVRVPSGDVRRTQQIGKHSTVEVQLTHPQLVDILNYFVIAGGKIVHKGAKDLVNLNTALNFMVTHDMAPSARVVAYYTKDDGRVITDALLVDVEEKCKNPIGLSFRAPVIQEGDVFKSDRSGQNVDLEITGKRGTRVGLLAVDEAVFKLRKYHRLTQKKVFKRMAGYDLGCGPGGGQDAAAIFKDAGITVLSNANLNIPHREALGCSAENRRVRRSVNDTEREQILSRYEGDEREYCEKGLRELAGPTKLTCAVRAKLMARRKGLSESSSNITAFYECCTELDSITRGRSSVDESSGVNLEDISVRSNFPESWMFEDVVLPPLGEEDGRALHQSTLPDSVTTWVIEAVGVSDNFGMCVANPIKLEVRPPFFLDLGMPYSVQRFEQIEIVATVFNYADRVLEVTIYLKGKDGLCSVAQPDEYSEGTTIEVRPKRPASIKFVIVPLEVKDVPIEIVAVDKTGGYQDGIIKHLTVRPEGFEKKIVVPVILDPANSRGSDSSTNGGEDLFYEHRQQWGNVGEEKQVDAIRYTINGAAIPGTQRARMSLIGNVLGSVVETVLGGLDKLLRIPTGCGEQTMLGLGPNVYVYTYLKNTDQFTANLETASRQYIADGVKRELTFRKDDGSFSVWPSNYDSSTWLTAFVAKVFCKAKEFAFVDERIICKAMEWLITQTQSQDDGSFSETYRVHHREMTGGVQGKASLTAYVLISLLECECDTFNKDDAVARATTFLGEELEKLTRPYAIAITAYALALANSDKAGEAIGMLKDCATYAGGSRYWAADDSSFGGGQKPYWYSYRPKAIEVETTSYALLALLTVDDIPYTHAIVNWLSNQENYNGGFVSTQDTVMALQALSEYAYRVQQYEVNIECTVKCEQSDFDQNFELTADDALVRRAEALRVPESSRELNVYVTSSGSGLGQFKFEATYYTPEPDIEDCEFELEINEDENPQVDLQENDDKEYFSYDIQVRYLQGGNTGMAILEVGLFTGYTAIEEDLEREMENSDGQIQRYETTDHSVVFYFEEIRGLETTRIRFRAERKFEVGKVQPVAVHVYDYYNPTEECVKFISPKEGSAMLGTLCKGDTCVCAAGKCAPDPTDKSRDYNVYNLKQMACASQAHFAYDVIVDGVVDKGNFKFYTMRISAPLKQGLDDVVEDTTRTFVKSKTCETPNLEEGLKYLLIGSGGLPTKDDMGQEVFTYVIDERMFFYKYPTQQQSTRGKWKRIVEKLVELKRQLLTGEGCGT
ncbi:A.superbus venom factor 1-like [Acanthaster planci]|uniref:A.superbus venom factor 1-like n=1 Tax=Acanthaster planci TaxID=133434 RepID=A0A8B7ZIK6_ACAPL|nr:A.superbus venom factor 1-like [Acanthaster planci]